MVRRVAALLVVGVGVLALAEAARADAAAALEAYIAGGRNPSLEAQLEKEYGADPEFVEALVRALREDPRIETHRGMGGVLFGMLRTTRDADGQLLIASEGQVELLLEWGAFSSLWYVAPERRVQVLEGLLAVLDRGRSSARVRMALKTIGAIPPTDDEALESRVTSRLLELALDWEEAIEPFIVKDNPEQAADQRERYAAMRDSPDAVPHSLRRSAAGAYFRRASSLGEAMTRIPDAPADARAIMTCGLLIATAARRFDGDGDPGLTDTEWAAWIDAVESVAASDEHAPWLMHEGLHRELLLGVLGAPMDRARRERLIRRLNEVANAIGNEDAAQRTAEELALIDPLRIEVTVSGPDGEPVGDFALSASYDADLDVEVADGAMVGVDGTATLRLPRPAGAMTVVLTPSPSLNSDPLEGVSLEDMRSVSRKFWDGLRSRYHHEMHYAFEVEAGQASLDAMIRFGHSVTVSGRLVDGAGEPIRNSLVFERRTSWWANAGSETGAFRLGGAPRGEPLVLFFGEGAVARPYRVEASDTRRPLDLGDVTFEAPESDAAVLLRMRHDGWWPERSSLMDSRFRGWFVSLIAADASHIIYLHIDRDGWTKPKFSGPPGAVPIPSGRYLVLPGPFKPSDDLAYKAFELVRTGAAVRMPEWPSINVAPGETAEIEFEAAMVDALIDGAPAPR